MRLYHSKICPCTALFSVQIFEDVPFLCQGVGDSESTEGKQGIVPSVLTEETAVTLQEAANDDVYRTDGVGSLWNQVSLLNVLNGEQYIAFSLEHAKFPDILVKVRLFGCIILYLIATGCNRFRNRS